MLMQLQLLLLLLLLLLLQLLLLLLSLLLLPPPPFYKQKQLDPLAIPGRTQPTKNTVLTRQSNHLSPPTLAAHQR